MKLVILVAFGPPGSHGHQGREIRRGAFKAASPTTHDHAPVVHVEPDAREKVERQQAIRICSVPFHDDGSGTRKRHVADEQLRSRHHQSSRPASDAGQRNIPSTAHVTGISHRGKEDERVRAAVRDEAEGS